MFLCSLRYINVPEVGVVTPKADQPLAETSKYRLLVPERGFEPPLLTKHAPQACASASSATRAIMYYLYYCSILIHLRHLVPRLYSHSLMHQKARLWSLSAHWRTTRAFSNWYYTNETTSVMMHHAAQGCAVSFDTCELQE